MLYPTCRFEHMGLTFDPKQGFPADHPMVVARPDLFTAETPKSAPTKKK